MPAVRTAPPPAKPSTRSVPAPAAPPGLVSSVALHSFTPSLLVVCAAFPGPNGVTEHLSLATPAAPYGTAPWQTAALALYLDAARAGREGLSGAALRDFLDPRRAAADGREHPARLPFEGPAIEYPHNVLHDRRVTCVLSARIGHPVRGRWPEAELLVWEREEGRPGRGGRCGFDRTVRHAGALAILAAAVQEMESEHLRLAARARLREGTAAGEGLAQAAGLAKAVGVRCLAALNTARADAERLQEQDREHTQKEGAARARRALRLPSGSPEHAVRAEERPQAQVVTGTLTRPVEVQHVEGRGTVARLQIAVDELSPLRGGAAMPPLLLCALEGKAAEAAAGLLKAGDAVVAAGRIRIRHHRGRDRIPRSTVFLDVERIGADITRA